MRSLMLMAVACLMVVWLAACGSGSVKTVVVTVTATPSTQSAGAGSDGSGYKPSATIGDTLTVESDVDPNLSLAITVKKTELVPALVGNGNNGWSAGEVVHPALYGVELSIKNVGTAIYNDSVTGKAAAIDLEDQQHQALSTVTDLTGNLMDGALENVNISPGDTRSGWVWFDNTGKLKLRSFQYSLASQGASQAGGEWSLR